MFIATGIHEADLKNKGRKVVRRNGKQVLLLAPEGKVHAIANRCPHEGYPLMEGTEGPGCVLTCNWHNWKFDLETGEALVGRDPVRVYPVELREGEVFVDLTDPPAEAMRERALKGIEAGLAYNDMPRMARELARLEKAGFDATEGLVHAIAVRNARLEDGTTHAHGAAFDWLTLADRAPTPEARLTAIIEPMFHLAWDTSYAGTYPYAEGAREWDAAGFLAAIEGEREVDAIGFVRGALAGGVAPAALAPVLGEAALAHYADFGHSAIYALKIQQLIGRLGAEAAEPLLLAYTRGLARQTREDKIPEFRGYAKALAAWDGSGAKSVTARDFVGLSIDAAMARVLESSGRPARELFDALLGAAAFNMLHFDAAIDLATDNAIADNISWLDFTHALTFANAVRHICAARPDLWPKALLQMALFVGRNKSYVAAEQDVARWRVNDRGAFIKREMDGLYDHGIVEPIIACHRVKMLFALEDELVVAPDAPWADDMSAAMNRWLNTPQKRHHGLRNARQALDFIAKEG
ncbi:MAG TPA: Rieske (2Fe-2S) protein [Rhizomicrobium sp.]|jgi:nitrite reductase/ring-hydroxylating ferredoxin subunit|nr:Rieske (2Fe-2S) protein [Rhizomicrobium sp.]